MQPEERTKLELMAQRPQTDQRTAQRARIVLDCAAGLSNTAVAAKRGVTIQTVGDWRKRLREDYRATHPALRIQERGRAHRRH